MDHLKYIGFFLVSIIFPSTNLIAVNTNQQIFMLSGHPNFLADVKSSPVMAAFLFPMHPEAKTWEDMFGKYFELNTRYHTRPDVKSWDAKGGRWTENLGTYVWAFLRPTIRANFLLQNYFEGKNHLANANSARLGSWLLNSLSAPYNEEPLSGSGRVYPPQGAHASRRKPPCSFWLFGQALKNYDPLLSENITANHDAGISAILSNDIDIRGECSSPGNAEIKFKWNRMVPNGVIFYLDGVLLPCTLKEREIIVNIPAGKHIWNLTTGLPDLSRPVIVFTRYENGKVLILVQPVEGAGSYRFEYSNDVGNSWIKLNEPTKNMLQIKALGNETKGHIRVVALNKEHESQASVIYPVYFTLERPHYPDGLNLEIRPDQIDLTWGNVLGCDEFRLYRKLKGANKYKLIFSGKNSSYTDHQPTNGDIYEYVVTTVNGNGESDLSPAVDSDPGSWPNFYPVPGEGFRRSINLYDGSRDNSGFPFDLYYPK